MLSVPFLRRVNVRFYATKIALIMLFTLLPALSACRKGRAEGAAAGPASFTVQAVVVAARVQSISETLSLVGTLAANEMVEIKSETDGLVQEVGFEEGHKVKAGQLLLRLDEVKFATAVDQAEANFKLSRATYDRARQLYEQKLISQQEHDQAAAQFEANQAGLQLKKRELKDARIVAPFAGVVSSRQVSPGQVISKNTTLTWLVDLDPVKVEVGVPERFVGQLRVGQKLEITVAAFPGRTFAGEVFFVAPFLEPVTRTALVKARVPNPQHELKPGMFANLDLALRLKEHAVMIPESAIMATGDRTLIYVLDDKDAARLRPVKIGLRQVGSVEIAEGLKPGERVVIEGVQKIRPGGTVKPTAPQEVGAGSAEKQNP